MPSIRIDDFFDNSKAYFVGVADYKSALIPNLKSPPNDIAAFAEILKDRHGFQIEPVITPQSGGAQLANPNLNGTKEDILSFLDHIDSSENDRILIYIAGHGRANNSDTFPEGEFLPADSKLQKPDSFIKMGEIVDRLEKLKCRHLMLILDCCYAGAFNWARRTKSSGIDVPRNIHSERFRQFARNKSWVVITSAAYDQLALDDVPYLGRRGESDDTGMSPFAIILCDALRTGRADLSYGNLPADGLITVSELMFFIRQEIIQVLENRNVLVDKEQIPSLYPISNDNKGEFLFLHPNCNGVIELPEQLNENPYKGLEAYTKADNRIFYGRDRVLNGWETERTRYEGLLSIVASKNIIVVTGPSGIGKSSLVQARILSDYRECGKSFRPGRTPYSSLGHELKTIINSPQRHMVLIDQFEELVTMCRSKTERKEFTALLIKLVEASHKLILTIRSDFEQYFQNSDLLTRLQDQVGYFTVPPFDRNEIRDIVIQPAAQELLLFRSRTDSEVDNQKFINRIIDDSYLNPGSLPLLSLALSELYLQKQHRSLLEKVYIQFNGITGIIDRKLNAVYEGLRESSKSYFRQLIFRLISYDSGTPTKRRIYTPVAAGHVPVALAAPIGGKRSYDELEFADRRKTTVIRELVELLLKERLLSVRNEGRGLVYIEATHDALLQAPMITHLIEKDEKNRSMTHTDRVQLHFRLIDQVKDHANGVGNLDGYLWDNDPRLVTVDKELSGFLNLREQDFVNASFKRKKARRNIRVAVLSLIFLGTLIAAIVFFIQKKRIQNESDKNLALYLSSESDGYGPTDAIRILQDGYFLDSTQSSIQKKLTSQFQKADDEIAFAFQRTWLGGPMLLSASLGNNIAVLSPDSIFMIKDVSGKTLTKLDHIDRFILGRNKNIAVLIGNAKYQPEYQLITSSGQVIWKYPPQKWHASYCYFSADDRYLIIPVSEDDATQVHLSKLMAVNVTNGKVVQANVKQDLFSFNSGNDDIAFYEPDTRLFYIRGYTAANDIYRDYILTLNGDLRRLDKEVLNFEPAKHLMITADQKGVYVIDTRHPERVLFKTDPLPTTEDVPVYETDGQLLIRYQKKGFYVWDKDNSGETPVLSIPNIEEISGCYFSADHKFVTVFAGRMIYRYHLPDKRSEVVSISTWMSNNNGPFKIEPSQDGKRFLVRIGEKAIAYDAVSNTAKKLSDNNLNAAFKGITGDTICFDSPRQDAFFSARFRQFGADISGLNIRSDESLKSIDQLDEVVIFSGDSSRMQVVSAKNNAVIKGQSWKRIAGDLARYADYLGWYKIRDNGILFYRSRQDSTFIGFKFPSGPVLGKRVFYSYQAQKAVIRPDTSSLWLADIRTSGLTRINFHDQLYSCYFTNDKVYLTGFRSTYVYLQDQHMLKTIKSSVVNVNWYGNFNVEENFNQSGRINIINGKLVFSFIDSDKTWSWSEENRAVESGYFIGPDHIAVIARSLSNSNEKDVILFDKSGHIIYRTQGAAINNMVYNQHYGKIYYTENSAGGLKVYYTARGVLRQIDQSGIPKIGSELIDRYKLKQP